MVLTGIDDAQAILSSDQNNIWHEKTLYNVPIEAGFYDSVELSTFLWVIGEGVAYITGAVLYSFHKVKYIHTAFHFFVLLGTFCHMMAVWNIIN